jgi:hypothetical protein
MQINCHIMKISGRGRIAVPDLVHGTPKIQELRAFEALFDLLVAYATRASDYMG